MTAGLAKRTARRRIAELDRKIDALPGWGAAMAAYLKERDRLARQHALPLRSNILG